MDFLFMRNVQVDFTIGLKKYYIKSDELPQPKFSIQHIFVFVHYRVY